ncbi:MAG: hypothetical protein K8S16_21050 [Bacteroidales bacterium]|nr:hypothetical protein [Bacteroidales bacterium]
MKIKLVFIFSTIIVVIAFLVWTHNFLSFHKPVNTNHYLIESWVSPYEVEEAVSNFRNNPDVLFYIVGKKYDEDTIPKETLSMNRLSLEGSIRLLANASIIFRPNYRLLVPGQDSIQIIIRAKGTKARNLNAHVIVAINGKFTVSFFTANDFRDHIFSVASSEKIEMLTISFNNDLHTKTEDRNLEIASIIIDNQNLLNGPYFTTKEISSRNTGFTSSAYLLANYLHDLGIKKNRIVSIEFEESLKNQTLAGAKAFKSILERDKPPSINLISAGIHSRRTYITYRYFLGSEMEVGIIYYKPIGYKETNWYKNPYGYLELLEEMASYLINYAHLKFYKD